MRSWDCETGVLSSFGQVGAGLVLWHLFSDCFVKENRILPAYVHLLKQRTVRCPKWCVPISGSTVQHGHEHSR